MVANRIAHIVPEHPVRCVIRVRQADVLECGEPTQAVFRVQGGLEELVPELTIRLKMAAFRPFVPRIDEYQLIALA